MKYVGNCTRTQAAEEIYHRTKVENLKKVQQQAGAQLKKVQDNSKVITASIKSPDKQPTSRVFLEEDVTRVHAHKEMTH